ncbi:hypothetical protein G6F42_022946 [Rhizopus arrhizus]|nr:hypothetical protein G6F42_022946 [Rhizopus arrhizus]
MLSNVDSFCLDDDVLVKPSFAKSPFSSVDAFSSEEHARYAKRRNTTASDIQQQQPEQQPEQQATLVVMSYPIANEKPSIHDTVSSFEDLEFSKLPDLRLSFNIQQDQQHKQQEQQIPASTKSSKTHTSSKTRRFFSLLL